MNGTKEKTDGNVRKDFPGGFAGDSHNAFTAEGRSEDENAMFNWVSKLLHWRQNNEVITKGKQIQFVPFKGVYVIARQYEGKTVLTILNGTSKDAIMPITRYAEVLGSNSSAKDVVTENSVDISKDIKLQPRQSMIIEF